jgi:hypothetical protein
VLVTFAVSKVTSSLSASLRPITTPLFIHRSSCRGLIILPQSTPMMNVVTTTAPVAGVTAISAYCVKADGTGSVLTKCNQRVDSSRAPCRHPAGQRRHAKQSGGREGKGQRVGRRDSIKQAGKYLRKSKSPQYSN